MLIGLLRHGIAEEPGPATDYRDAPRRLTPRGVERMEREAHGMRRLGITPDVVLHSPLVRCVQTAQIVGGVLGVPLRRLDSLAPGARTDAVLDAVAEYPDAEVLMFCGHQPDMSLITAELTGGAMVDYKKGSLGLVEADSPGPGRGVLRALYPPRVLRVLGDEG